MRYESFFHLEQICVRRFCAQENVSLFWRPVGRNFPARPVSVVTRFSCADPATYHGYVSKIAPFSSGQYRNDHVTGFGSSVANPQQNYDGFEPKRWRSGAPRPTEKSIRMRALDCGKSARNRPSAGSSRHSASGWSKSRGARRPSIDRDAMNSRSEGVTPGAALDVSDGPRTEAARALARL
jgi:hypothetical protein